MATARMKIKEQVGLCIHLIIIQISNLNGGVSSGRVLWAFAKYSVAGVLVKWDASDNRVRTSP